MAFADPIEITPIVGDDNGGGIATYKLIDVAQFTKSDPLDVADDMLGAA